MTTQQQPRRQQRGLADTTAIQAWEDDPGAPPQVNVPVRHPIPALDIAPLPTAIAAPAPSLDGDAPGTEAFRYWAAADALSSASRTWGALVPEGTTWHRTVGPELTANLDEGVDLNASYDRGGIWFFHQTVAGITVFSGESPDVVRHEFGHAALDAIRPQLWNAASAEADAMHEACGDISALLTTLQLESMRILVLSETQGDLEQSSRLSRMAEQLGWAIRQSQPTSVDPDCLRNMSNKFFYRDPVELPPLAPASELASEPHSFSRVFGGAFLKALARIFLQQDRRDPEGLAEAATIAGQLFVDALATAPVVSGYYAQVAGHMIAADQERYGGIHGQALRSAFIRHGILSLESAAAMSEAETGIRAGSRTMAGGGLGGGSMTGAGAAGEDGLNGVTVDGAMYGLSAPVTLSAPVRERRFGIAASAPAGGSVQPAEPEVVATSYLEDLFRRGRVAVSDEDLTDTSLVTGTEPPRTRTHAITRSETDEGLALVRRCFT
jgi:hypothetical protein